ncbi:hypothetical protein K440DRAFT_651632 [Wilcoxina mikolae CBS 423.85]|nr:hypothetical protein K440DRAFT_651632 [Wilcoxina mikolae CBS 423.85]
MSPSRGLFLRLHRRQLHTTHAFPSLLTSQLPTQIYVSQSHDPYLNLSLEHHLFTTLPSRSRTLLLYRNTPCVVIGRNQNPWLETHHPLLLSTPTISLLRRRSGGGTVYHDLGNTNYSVTVPTSTFDRDTHAHLITRALQTLNVPAAVNKRHDIVVLPSAGEKPDVPGARKCSGSAYKLTRHRSYHHGTMLLSADLANVSSLLKSPAADIISARGVASVPSLVANTKVEHDAFVDAVVSGFLELYLGEAGVCKVGEDEARDVEGVKKGMRELESMEWVYGQTPRFTIRWRAWLGRGLEVTWLRGA